jgi:diaminopimelate epimerase
VRTAQLRLAFVAGAGYAAPPSLMRLAFSKYEGTANDFLVVEKAMLGARNLSPDDVVALCDRHRGVGGDGVLVVDWEAGRGSMHVINADGSEPEMCGNGLRCVVAHFRRTGRIADGTVVVDTDAGPHECRITTLASASEADVEVTMRVASLEPAVVPVRAPAPLRDAPFGVDGQDLHVTAISMGNPHIVTFDDLATPDARLVLGPRIERDSRFPEGVNVGFARIVPAATQSDERPRIVLHVFERGAGWTEACGTGACAAAVASVETGRLPRNTTVPVTLPGGTLEITVGGPDEPVRMRGPARHVFDGHVELADRMPT